MSPSSSDDIEDEIIINDEIEDEIIKPKKRSRKARKARKARKNKYLTKLNYFIINILLSYIIFNKLFYFFFN